MRSNPTIERDAREKAARAPHCERYAAEDGRP